MKSILDKDFKYVPAIKTDIRKTFARIRQEMATQADLGHAKVLPIHAPPEKNRKAN